MARIKTVSIALSVMFLYVSTVSAAENEGFIQRLKKRFAWQKPAPKVDSAPAAAVVNKIKAAVPAAKTVEAAKPEAVQEEKPKKDIAAADIEDMLNEEEDILELVPGIKTEKSKDGKIYYTYNGKRLQDMNKEELEEFYVLIKRARQKIRMDRINRQLDMVRKVEKLNAQRLPPVPPKAPSAPVSPRVVQAPKTPHLPPSPPKR